MCYNRPEVIFMTLDRPHARQAFAEYTSHYNAADPKVKLKIDHTYRVAALCERIANSLSLAPAGCRFGLAVRPFARCGPVRAAAPLRHVYRR